jgi:hypothetical protein
MGVSEILAAVDVEIAKLQQARALLTGVAAPTPKKPVGRPKKIVPTAASAPKKAGRKKKRNLTPEGRKRIAEAVKRRWAAQKKASGSASK